MADGVSDDSSSDLYGTPRYGDTDPPSCPASAKRKSEDQVDGVELPPKRSRTASSHSHRRTSPTPPTATARDTHSASPPGSSSRQNDHRSAPWTPSRPDSISSTTTGLPGPRISSSPPRVRNREAANKRMAARKAEIERRCGELEPPISPMLLSRMNAFNAAIKIALPLNDQAWENLKPKLILEREPTESLFAEEEKVVQDARNAVENTQSAVQNTQNTVQDIQNAVQDTQNAVQNNDDESNAEHRPSLKESKDAETRMWAAGQQPIRDRLGPLADDHIRDRWAGGDAVNYHNSPEFVADCLIQVRSKYIIEGSPEDLVLDAMKWVYDNKLKHIAEAFRKDLFLCADCDAPWKAFEGCIQHFAAKHVSAFGVGPQVVAWQIALWPLKPPFKPDPLVPRKRATPNPSRSIPPAQGTYYGPPPHPYAHPSYPTPPPFSATHHGYPYPMPPNHAGASGYSAHLDQSQYYRHGAYTAPPYSGQMTPVSQTNFQYSSYQVVPQPYTSKPSQGWPAPPHGSACSPPPVPGYGYLPPEAPFPGNAGYRHVPFSSHPSNVVSAGPPNTLYNSQREEFARAAKEIWSILSDVDIPPSVRIYTVLSQAVSIFRSRFKNELSLEIVLDCVLYNPLLAPLKNANGLACKLCVLKHEDLEEPHSSSVFQFSSGGRKLYPFHSLLQHFKNVHVGREISRKQSIVGDSETPTRLDWKEDMVELPDSALITSLVHTKNMDAIKLRVLAGAFPTNLPDYVVGRPSSSHSVSPDNEYDPTNPILFSGRNSHSRESSQGHARVGDDDLRHCCPRSYAVTDRIQPLSHLDRYSPHLGKRKRPSDQDFNPSIIQLEDGEDYQLVPVGSRGASHRDAPASLYGPAAPGRDRHPSDDAAAQFLGELETEPQYRRPAKVSRSERVYSVPPPSGRQLGMVSSGRADEHGDTVRTGITSSSRVPYYAPAPREEREYVYVPTHSRMAHHDDPQDRPIKLESPSEYQPSRYREDRFNGHARRGRVNRY